MKFVFNLVSVHRFSFFHLGKVFQYLKKELFLLISLNPEIHFFNRKNRYVQLGSHIYLPDSSRVISLFLLDTLHLKEVKVLPFKIQILMPNFFSLSQVSLRYVCFLLFLPDISLVIVLIKIISYYTKNSIQSENNQIMQI